MAVIPIAQPLAPGLLAVDYSPVEPAARARSFLAGTPGEIGLTNLGQTGLSGYSPDETVTFSAPGGPKVGDERKKTGGYTGSGLPMPEVEGYKYVYPRYTYEKELGSYLRDGYEEDMDTFDYYPYMPYGLTGPTNILVGVELLKE